MRKMFIVLLGFASAAIIIPRLIEFIAWILEPDYIRCNAGRIEA